MLAIGEWDEYQIRFAVKVEDARACVAELSEESKPLTGGWLMKVK